jgi:tetratricopeptide (TPR) repeat protein
VLGGVDAMVLRGRCLSYGEGITYWPLLEVLQSLDSRPSDERAAAVLDAVQGTSDVQVSPEEIAWAFRKLAEELASARPVVCVFDDLHWAEPVFLDLVEHVADLSRGFPILLLCMARPELLDSRPGWGGGKLNASTVLLEPLSAGETEILIARLMGDAALDPELTTRIGRAADGNPLFVEEMVAMLEEAGADDVAVPPTIQALLAARLDQLPGEERQVLAHGAVEGHVFHRGAVEALGVDASDVHVRLAALVRKELVRPTAAQLAGDDGFRFRHLLIRDAAYDALPKAARAELHERFAHWLAVKGIALPELDEIVAWHLEQSVRYRLELGLQVEAALVDRAVERLTAAGERATTLGDAGAAANFLGRALELLPAGDPRRPELAVGLAESILPAVRVEEADTLLREAEADSRTRAQATLARFEWFMYAKPDEIAAFAAAELPPLMAEFERTGDEAGLARAHIARARVHQLAGRHAALADEALMAVGHARRAGQQRLVNEAATMACWGLAIGPEPAASASRKLGELGELGADSAFFRASVPFTRGYLRMLEGDLSGARGLINESRALYGDLGMEVYRWAVLQEIGMVEMRAGNYAEAITQLERASAALEQLGEHGYRSTCTALLAKALYLDGQADAAEPMAREALRQSAEIDALNFVIAQGVLALLAADAGRLDEAEELARAAVADSGRAEMPMLTAAALETLGHVLLERGRVDEGIGFLERALAVAEAKEDRFEAARLRAALDAAATAR